MVKNVWRVIKNDICVKNFVCCCNTADKIKLFAADLYFKLRAVSHNSKFIGPYKKKKICAH